MKNLEAKQELIDLIKFLLTTEQITLAYKSKRAFVGFSELLSNSLSVQERGLIYENIIGAYYECFSAGIKSNNNLKDIYDYESEIAYIDIKYTESESPLFLNSNYLFRRSHLDKKLVLPRYKFDSVNIDRLEITLTLLDLTVIDRGDVSVILQPEIEEDIYCPGDPEVELEYLSRAIEALEVHEEINLSIGA